VTFARFVVGAALLVVIVAAAGVLAVRLRERLVRGWSGAPARLVELVLAAGAITVVSELLGTVGGFRIAPLTIAMVVLAAVAHTSRGWRPADPTPSEPAPPESWGGRAVVAVAAIVAAAVFAQWTSHTIATLRDGMSHYDSLWYHLSRAARFVQDASVTKLHFTRTEFPDTFHPSGSELLHAIGMLAFRREVISPYLNLGWLVAALLAGWCIGRPFGVAPLTTLAVAMIMASPLMADGHGGTASNDVAAIALLLAAVAIVVQPGGRGRGAVAVAGVAAGLAVGVKLTVAAPAVVLALGIAWLAPRRRLATAATFIVPMVVAGGVWYVRNWARAGTPEPAAHLPLLPHPAFSIVDRQGYAIADYVTNSAVVRHWFVPGLRADFGWVWPLVLVVGALGAVVALARRTSSPTVRLLGVAALAGLVQYVVTPTTALGPRDQPLLFASNVAYAVPGLALGAVLLPVAFGQLRGRAPLLLAGGLTAVVVVEWFGRSVPAWDSANAAVGVVIAAALVGALAVARVLSTRSRVALAAAATAVVVAGMPVAWSASRHYLRDRWSDRPVFAWAKAVSDSRIAVAGFIQQYPFTGTRLDNRVQYVGVKGPHGEYHEVTDCAAWRDALRAGRYGYVVLGRESPDAGLDARRREWTSDDPASTQILAAGGSVVYRFDWRAPPAAC
jgi:hypothetical protein